MAENPEAKPVSPVTIENLKSTSTATLTTQLFKRGFRNTFMQDVRPLASYRSNMVGAAFTLRYIPAREDLDSYGAVPDPNALQREVMDSIPEGHVLVMDCRRDPRAASAGDVYVTRLMACGAAGIVTDGGIRDSAAIARLGLPVFFAGPSAPSNRILHRAVDHNVPIGCGGVAVYPGDIMVGDADGIVVVPRGIVDEVAADAAEQERLENYIRRRVAKGELLQGLYPVSDRTRADYAGWLRTSGD